jgi:exopolysaccharide biosynthesis polyprenyl glycosylphosphotransferase
MARTESPITRSSLIPLEATAVYESRAATLRVLRPDVAGTVAEDLLLQDVARQQLNVAAARRDSTFRRLLGVADLLAGGAALVTTGAIFVDTSVPLFAALIVLVPVAKMYGLYDRDEYVLNKTTLDEVPTLLTVALVFVLSAFAARDVLVSDEALIGAGQLVVMATLTLAFLTAGRVIARCVGRFVTTPERCLLIGEAEACDRLAGELVTSSSLKVVVAGRVRLGADAQGTDPALLIQIGSLRQVVRERRIDRLILVPDGCSSEAVPDLIRAVKSVGVKVSLVSRMHDVVGSAMEIDDIGGRQLMGVRAMKMSASSSFLKRLMDLAGAGFGLLIASPIFAVAALAIKLDSRGPVFYRQPRIGLNGESFKMIKFRSMRVGADAERDGLMKLNETTGLFKIADDPRVTRVGRLLRSCAFDELPQLLNVLRGEMSLVGPRPLVPDEDENITGWYRRRSRITPGITGVWQLLGPVRIPLDEMVKLDYLYVTHWSLWVDMKILLRTIPYVLGRRGL